MEIFVDYREAEKHPMIVSALKDGGKNKITIKTLDCGDYFCPPVLVEAKVTLSDYVSSVKSGRIFQQAQDMLYSKQQAPDLKLLIIIAGDIADIWKLQKYQKIQAEPLIAAWASLNVQGIPTAFIGNQWFFIKGLLYLFEKYNDGKERNYNPMRMPVTSDNQILTNYMSIDGIGEPTAKKLKERFPVPRDFYNATKEQLMEVKGIGKKTAGELVSFFKGEKT